MLLRLFSLTRLIEMCCSSTWTPTPNDKSPPLSLANLAFSLAPEIHRLRYRRSQGTE